MLISIIIPSYRQPHFLGRAIESCLEQDHANLEVIVVEDRSRDASLGVALSYAAADDRVSVIECDENGGLGRARNIGIAHANGEYLCFLDSDDYLLDRSLSARIEALPGAIEAHGEAVVGVYGDWQHVAESIDHPTVRAPRTNMTVVQASNYTGENVFICSAPLVRRDAVVAAGGFPEGLRMLEDFALWAKMISTGAIFVPVQHVVATYRQRPNSMLRGDGLVVMADHVDVINNWVTDTGVTLADGGAMRAWLAGEQPFSYGRMSWNVPSMLGNFGGAPGASAVKTGEGQPSVKSNPALHDFMTNPTNSGLTKRSSVWSGKPVDHATMVVVVRSLQHSLEAISIAADEPGVAIAAADPSDWSITWPLALDGHSVLPLADIDPGADLIDLDTSDQRFSSQTGSIEAAVSRVWGEAPVRSGGVVYVPTTLADYPALDAWVSTALHTLAHAGLEPVIVCDPSVREYLGGYRSTLVSIDTLRAAAVIVAPCGDHLELLNAVAPTVVFDPSSDPSEPAARTAKQLAETLP